MSLQKRGLLVIVLAPTIMAFATGAMAAEKLVIFKNGKAMRVKSAVHDGRWLKCGFDDKNYISVPASGVLRIEETTAGPDKAKIPANQVAAGTRGSASRSLPGRGGVRAMPAIAGATPRAGNRTGAARNQNRDLAAALKEESEGRRRSSGLSARQVGRNRRIPAASRRNSTGFQPLTQRINAARPQSPVQSPAARRGLGRKRDRGNATQLPNK